LVLIVELTLEESCARQQAGYGERRGIVLHIAEVWQDSLRVFLAGLMVPVRHERWPESALLRPSPWARRGGTVCPSCWYQGDAVPRRGTAGGAERLCTHALVAEQVPCQRVRGIRACGTPLAHHESTEARRGDEAHHAKSALPICGHLQQGGCQAREETTNVTDGAPHPGLAMREPSAVAVREGVPSGQDAPASSPPAPWDGPRWGWSARTSGVACA
jgi:hypothetical protein